MDSMKKQNGYEAHSIVLPFNDLMYGFLEVTELNLDVVVAVIALRIKQSSRSDSKTN